MLRYAKGTLSERFIQFPLPFQHITQVVVSKDKIRVELNRFLVGSYRFVPFILIVQRNAQIVVSNGIVGVKFNNSTKNAFCLREIANLLRPIALLMQLFNALRHCHLRSC